MQQTRTGKQTHRQTDEQTSKQADKQMNRQTEQKANRVKDRQYITLHSASNLTNKNCSKLLFFSLQQISLTETKETKNVRLKC